MSTIKPVYALVGPDLFLQLEHLRALIAQAPKDTQRIDVEGESAQLADVLDELRSFAMFSSAKFVVVRDADAFITEHRESLENYVQKPAADSVLVFRCSTLPATTRLHKFITAKGQILDCKPPKPAELPNWIISRARQAHQMKLMPDAARALADLVGDDLGRLDGELAKLALQCDASASVGVEQVRSGVSFQREQELWDMTNELAAGNTTQALRRWRSLVQLDTSAEYRATTWLVIWLEKVRKALALKREGANEFTIANQCKIWPASAAKGFMQTANALGEAGAARLLNQLADIDHRAKTGLGEMAHNVERFIIMASMHA